MSSNQKTATSFNGDFAKLVPRNHVAQRLFSATHIYVEKNDTFHHRFMVPTGSGPVPALDQPVESSTDYDTHPDTDTEGSRVKSIQDLGHFVLSFRQDHSPEMPHLGWRVGRGTSKSPANRGVDLLLAKPGDNLGRSLASVHMIFRFNRGSGFLMLRGGSQKVPAEYNLSGIWEKLEFREEQLMFQFSTMLRAGVCEYELEYTIEEKHREAYFKQRDAFLQLMPPSEDDLQQVFQKMPGDSCTLNGRYLEFGTHGSGAFGWITQGVDTKTGDPIAIKELRIKSHGSRLEAIAEVNIGRRFLDKQGLLPILNSSCEHGHPHGCCDLEKFYIFMPHAQSDLSINFWARPEIPRITKLQWLREPLEGIKTLHAMGIMHRDIRPKNMLIVSTEPPRASLCDYGKAIEAERDKFTRIGPIDTLAPEVWTVPTDGPYNAKVDMWAYGYAIAEILGYSPAKYPGRDGYQPNNPHITLDRLSAILKMLRAHCSKATEDKSLVDLVSKLLVWDPQDRWSADQALKHECWNRMSQEREENQVDKEEAAKVGPSQTKRTQLKDPRVKPNEISVPAIIDTQEYSQETMNRIYKRYGV